MVASIGAITSPSQGVRYYEKDDVAHKEASAWAGRGAEAMGLSGAVEPEAVQKVLEGHVPGGRQLGNKARDGSIHHRPGVDVTLSAPKSVSLAALDGGAEIEKKPDRQIAEWGAGFETVERPMPGTGRGAAPDPAPGKDAGDSPEREADM